MRPAEGFARTTTAFHADTEHLSPWGRSSHGPDACAGRIIDTDGALSLPIRLLLSGHAIFPLAGAVGLSRPEGSGGSAPGR